LGWGSDVYLYQTLLGSVFRHPRFGPTILSKQWWPWLIFVLQYFSKRASVNHIKLLHGKKSPLDLFDPFLPKQKEEMLKGVDR
jgi:hypothetical protein